jgi:hypothetical protein
MKRPTTYGGVLTQCFTIKHITGIPMIVELMAEIEDRNEFLKYLIESGQIEDDTLEATEQVIEKGEKSLSAELFDAYFDNVIIDQTQEECGYCGSGHEDVSWTDYIAIHRDGTCIDCEYRLDIMLAE